MSGRVLREYLGYGFVRSLDRVKVAHVGLVIHFAPPWVKSNYLMVGNTILYPLPSGTKPVEQKLGESGPEVVKDRGLVYSGVHEFQGGFVWSPDSRRVGLIDCLIDYRLRDDSAEAFDEGGKAENRRCFVVGVGLDGSWRRKRIPDDSIQELKWTDARTLVTPGDRSVVVRVP